MRVLSGIQPSGAIHIGNYFGMIKKMVESQNNELLAFVANYHSMTSNTANLKANVRDVAINFLSLGLDPNRAIFWIQSDVKEVLELYWILSNFTPMGLLERAHSYKDKVAKGINANHGLFSYPVLMASDILLFGSNKVPVGKDQVQHLEITRDIALKFNNEYNEEIFVLPEALVDNNVAVVPGVDGAKMSKSYNNTIDIFVDYKDMKKKVMSIVTDSRSLEEAKDPDSCNIFAISKLFMNENELNNLRDRYISGGSGYGHFKLELLEKVWQYSEPYRERRDYYNSHIDEVYDILKVGATKAKEIANPIINRVREVTGINYGSI